MILRYRILRTRYRIMRDPRAAAWDVIAWVIVAAAVSFYCWFLATKGL